MVRLLLLGLLLPTLLMGQTETQQARGVQLAAETLFTGKTYAVIIGVSGYDTIPPLRFAHRDAEEFARFLHSPYYVGGPIADTLLLNSKATKFEIEKQIKRLIHWAEKGDRVIIFFAGHGDRESESDVGYLLAYDTFFNNYSGTGVSVDWLKRIIANLITQNNVTVWLIADACRSGGFKLAGDFVRGRYRVWESWREVGNELNFLSCQTDEVSYEDAKWGGGHGIFSYFLLKGLRGAADSLGNNDSNVRAFELDAYLKLMVPKGVSPSLQTPSINAANLQIIIAKAPPQVAHTSKISQKTNNKTQSSGISMPAAAADRASFTRDMKPLKQSDSLPPSNSVLKKSGNTEIDSKILPGRDPVKGKPFVKSDTTVNNEKIKNEEIYYSLMTKVQPTLLTYLAKGGSSERIESYLKATIYLTEAGKLLTKTDPDYASTHALRYFFQGLHLNELKHWNLAIIKLDSAIAFDSLKAFIYYERGRAYAEKGVEVKANEDFQKVAMLSPTWHNNLLTQKNNRISKAEQLTLQKLAERCKGLPSDKRLVVKIVRFNVSAKSTQANSGLGNELALMLTSAIQQTNCFRVVDMNLNAADVTGEIASSGSLSGTTQLVVTGEVTDLSEGNKSTQVGGFNFGNTATLGFTLKLLNPQTGELLFSRDINMKGNSSGFRGMTLGGANGLATVGSSANRAVQDAVQKAIIKAVEVMADAKDTIELPEPKMPTIVKRYSASDCKLLRYGSPKVIILVTETNHTTIDLNRRQRELALKEREVNIGLSRERVSGIFNRRRDTLKVEPTSRQTSSSAVVQPIVVEQSVTEIELIRQFVEAGFRVVDPKIYGKLRQIANSSADLSAIASLGLKMGANIIVTGQTMLERTNSQGGIVSYRARLEIRAIATKDGSILATNSVTGGGIDVSEAIANKIAVRNASENMTQYLFDKLCAVNINVISVGDIANSNSAARATTSDSSLSVQVSNITDISVTNASFAKLQTLRNIITKNPKVESVQKILGGRVALLRIKHLGSVYELIEILGKSSAIKFDVTALGEGKISLTMY